MPEIDKKIASGMNRPLFHKKPGEWQIEVFPGTLEPQFDNYFTASWLYPSKGKLLAFS